MPCTYYLPHEEEALRNESLNRATRLLCSVCRTMTAEQIASHGDDLVRWWEAHREMDRKREEGQR